PPPPLPADDAGERERLANRVLPIVGTVLVAAIVLFAMFGRNLGSPVVAITPTATPLAVAPTPTALPSSPPAPTTTVALTLPPPTVAQAPALPPPPRIIEITP